MKVTKKNSMVILTKLDEDCPGLYPPGYWLKGELINGIIVGEPIVLNRFERSARGLETEPQKIPGIFTSSFVQSIETVTENAAIVNTTNSTWGVELL